MAELATSIAGTMNTQDSLKRSTVTKSNILSKIQLASGTVKVMDFPEVRETQNLAGDVLIWGNLIFGIWNSYKWGNSANLSFILGNSLAGILGTSKLGSQASAYGVTEIINPNHIFRWMLSSLENTYWVDSGNTTCTVTAGTSISFTIGQILQTNILTTEASNLLTGTLFITSGNITSVANLAFYLSPDGTNWETVTLNSSHTFTNTGTDMKLKIVASGNATIALKDSSGIRTPISISYELNI